MLFFHEVRLIFARVSPRLIRCLLSLLRETRLQQRHLKPQIIVFLIFVFFCFLNLGEISEGRLGLLVRGERVGGVYRMSGGVLHAAGDAVSHIA